MIELIAEPKVVKTWEQFCKENPPYSIALDGYVSEPTIYDKNGPRLNLNHHEGINRIATRSVSAQTYFFIKGDLFNVFKENRREKALLYFNDVDQDVCLTNWLMKNNNKINLPGDYSSIKELVEIEDELDTMGGTYPTFPESDIMKKVAWIFEPYTNSRYSIGFEELNSDKMIEIVNNVYDRIDDYYIGRCGRIKPNTRYETYYDGDGWRMIREIGAHARTKLFWDGVKAFVSFKKNLDGNYSYIFGRISPLIPFDNKLIYEELNKVENIPKNDLDCYGGSDIIGGSPRKRGSKIDPKDMIKIINKVLKQ
jgi:hypothetical protein